MSVKDWIFLVLGILGAFSFGYCIGRQSFMNDFSNFLAAYLGKNKKDTDEEIR